MIKVAIQAEQAGFNSLWAYERVLFPVNPAQGMYGIDGLPWNPYYEYCADPLTVLTLAGAVTKTIRQGTSVLNAAQQAALGADTGNAGPGDRRPGGRRAGQWLVRRRVRGGRR